MAPSDLFKTGDLTAAIDAQIKEVKAQPADHSKRLFLFELLSFAGDMDRAKRQIDVVNYGEMEIDAVVLAYRKLVDAEVVRRRLFREGVQPKFLVDPPEHVQLRLDALNHLREKKIAEAKELLDRANAAAPALQGVLNTKPFVSLRDCDDVFGTVIEVMAHGEYYWLPLEQVDSVAMNAPKFPRDLIWTPARLQVKNGPAGEAYLPALYPQSHEHADNQIKLGRATDWHTPENGPVQGLGARTFLVDDDAVGLLEWRELQFV